MTFLLFAHNRGLIERSVGLPAYILALGQDAALVVLLLRGRPRLSGVTTLALHALVFWACVASVLGPTIGWTARLESFRAFLLPILPLAAGGRLATRQRQLALMNLVSVTMSATVGLRQAVFGLSGSEQSTVQGQLATFLVSGQTRLIGGLSTGQEFSLSLLTGIVSAGLLLYVYRSEMLTSQVRAVQLALGGIVVTQLLALQRTMLIGSLVFAVCATAMNRRRGAVTALRVLLGVCIIGIAAVLVGLSSDRLNVALQRAASVVSVGGDESFKQRTNDVWPEALDRLRDSPVSGSGLGSVGTISFNRDVEFPGRPLATDNMYLHMASQAGLVGLVLYLVMLASLWVSPVDRSTRIVLRSSLVATAACGVTGAMLGLISAFGVMTLHWGAMSAVTNGKFGANNNAHWASRVPVELARGRIPVATRDEPYATSRRLQR